MAFYFQNFPTAKYDIYANGKPIDIVDLSRIVKVKQQFKDDVSYYTYYNIQDGERPDIVSTKLYGSPDYYWTFFMINDNLVNAYTDWPLNTENLLHCIDKKYPGFVLTTNEDISNKLTQNGKIKGLISNAYATVTYKDADLGLIKVENIVNFNNQSVSSNFIQGEIIQDETTGDIITISNQVEFKDAVHHYENAQNEYVTKSTVGATPISNFEYEYNMNEERSAIKVFRREYIQAIADEFIKQINAVEE